MESGGELMEIKNDIKNENSNKGKKRGKVAAVDAELLPP
jgi:hypothetical protein